MNNAETKPEKLPKGIKYNKKDMSGRISEKPYRGQFCKGYTTYTTKGFATIREAQKAMDIKRLEVGLPPLLLKKVYNADKSKKEE